MTVRHNPDAVPGPLRRAGAVLAIAIVIATAAAGCSVADTAADTVRSAYAHASGLNAEQVESGQRRDTEILRWAEELGVDDQASDETTGYGARVADEWSHHRDRIEQRSQAIKDEIRDGLSLDDVRAYYAQHPELFEKQDALTLEVTEWEGGRASTTTTIDVDATNVRALQEYDDQVVSVALTLEQGAEQTVDRGDGRYAQVRCVRRTDAGTVPFDEVVQAAAGGLATEIFEAELENRIVAR